MLFPSEYEKIALQNPDRLQSAGDFTLAKEVPLLLRTPDFYDHFLCIGDSCKDCCCIGWELDIDDDTFEYYKSVPGPFGDRLRGCMSAARKVSPDAPGDDSLFGDDGGSTMYRLKIDGRCPFLNSKNLCDIVLNLGPQALCQICSEYPRYSFEFDGAVEKSLTISCEEAGRLMFLSDVPIGFVETEAGGWMPSDGPEADAHFPENDPEESGTDADLPENNSEESEADADLPKTDYEEDSTPADYFTSDDPDEEIFRTISLIRSASIRILENRRIDLADRIGHFLALCTEAQRALDLADSDPDLLRIRLPELVRLYTGSEHPEITPEARDAAAEGPGPCPDAEGILPFPEDSALLDAVRFGRFNHLKKRMDILSGMEILTDRWIQEISELDKVFISEDSYESILSAWLSSPDCRIPAYEHLLVYFVFRYFPLAAYDGSIIDKARFAVFGMLVIRDLDAARFMRNGARFDLNDRIWNAKICSKEVEHSDYNIEYLFGEMLKIS